jgi:RimJ/RimL family protein N-acetyltransferase
MTLRVERAEGPRGVARFVDVPWRLLRADGSRWIPPLRAMVKDALDTRRNPFYRDADRALFVAYRDGAPIGRVAAIENRWHNRHHGDRVGFFGFFDCADDQEAASTLFAEAEAWLAARGLAFARGPTSPSMNHECGLLVDGFDHPPVIMTPWNPPYYGTLVERAGYAKVRDLLGYFIPAGNPDAIPERLARLAERTRKRTRVTFRTLDLSILEREARKVLELYNEAWSGNWGFVPPSWEEFWHTAKDLKNVVAADFSFVAEVEGEIIGFMVIAHDINRILRTMPSGRLWPWNVARLLRGTRRIKSGRVILLGLRTEYRKRGLFPLFVFEALRRATEIDAEGAEASWVLDDNEALVAPLEALGFPPYKRWRIYQKPIG